MNYKEKFIEMIVSKGALQFGDFTLKSGRRSPYFFNLGNLCCGDDISTIGEVYADVIAENVDNVDVIYGPAYKGISIAVATSVLLSSKYGMNVRYSYHRKEAKQHGEGGQLVGQDISGDVIIVDDVITKGTAIRESISILKNYNAANVKGIIVALDRKERGQEHLSSINEIQKEYGVNVWPVITVNDIFNYANKELPSDISSQIERYQEEYCI